MKMNKRVDDFLNPGQVSVIAGGQTVYVFRKKVRWMYLNETSFDSYDSN